MSQDILIAGFDPTPGPGPITPSQLLQMVNAATVAEKIGLVYRNDTAPDTVTNPETKRFIWPVDDGSGNWTGVINIWDGSGWTSLLTNNGANLINGTVTINKLSVAGGNPFDVIQVNGAGTAFSFVTPASMFSIGSLPETVIAAGTNGDVLITAGGVAGWIALDYTFINAIIPVGGFAVEKLTPGSNSQVLQTIAGVATWASFNTGVPAIGTGDALKIIRVNAGETAYELVAPTAIAIAPAQITPGTNGNRMVMAGGSWQGLGNVVTYTLNPAPAVAGPSGAAAHSLGGAVDRQVWYAECTSTDQGYAVGDRIPMDSIVTSSGGFDWPAYTPVCDVTNVNIIAATLPGSGFYLFSNKTTGALANFTSTKWKLVGILERLI